LGVGYGAPAVACGPLLAKFSTINSNL